MPERVTPPDRKEPIRQAIVSAFAEVARPGAGPIALQPETFDGEAIEQDFKGHSWRDLPLAAVQKHAMVFLRPEARHHYLPAYLLAALDTLPAPSVDLDLYALKPPEDDRRFRQEYDPYTPAQKDAVRSFLAYARDEASAPGCKEAARLALARYWARAGQGEAGAAEEPAQTAQVRQAILRAFADVPYPGDRAIARDPDDWEGKDINLDFAGYHFRELPHAVLSYHYAALSFFSPEGMRFYLPAYLLAALDGDTNILDKVLYALAPAEGVVEERFRCMYAGFTPAQRRAVRRFLGYVRDALPDSGREPYVRQALDVAWGRGEEEGSEEG